MRITPSGPRGTGTVSNDGSISRDASSVDWLDRRADPLEEGNLAYAFYALLDDAALREVFGDFLVPGLELGLAH